jgi:hypothetical protein
MTIPPRRGEVFPNGLDDGVRAPSNGAPAFSSNSLAMSVRKVAGPSKMIEKTSTVTEETATSVKASPAGGVPVRRPHTIAITTAASLGLGVGAMMPAQWQALTGVALGGQCYRRLDGNNERLCVADTVDEMASWLTMALIHQDGMGGSAT